MSLYSKLASSWDDTRTAIAGVQPLDYGALREQVARARGWLAVQKVGPGDVVALQLPKGAPFLSLHLAALGMGITTLPINDRAPTREAQAIVADAGARLFITTPPPLDTAPSAPLGPPPADSALALLCYTSGTTGQPKGVGLTHANLEATLRALRDAWRWQREDVLVHALPMTHIHGLVVAQLGALFVGATTFWMDHFEPRAALEALQTHRATVFMGVPTFYRRLVEHGPLPGADLTSMRLFTSGSAALPAETHRAFTERFGHDIVERYGMTEVGIVLSNPYDGERRPGTVGKPLPGVEARLEDGELLIRGASVFSGYLRRPDQTAAVLQDGWMRTGDLATCDDNGYYRIVGRKKDLIITGGFNVVPAEVEAVFLEHPAVADVAVVGAPDADLGERVVATVVLIDSAGAPPPSPEDLLAFVRDRLTPYKRPRAVSIASGLPRNTMGKVQKHLLRAGWAETVVRPGRPDDIERIAAWNVAMARETESLDLDPPTVLQGVRAVFDRDVGAFYLIAERAGRPIGQCMVTLEWSDWRARQVWWIQSVYVHPDWRRRGAYRALHEAVVDRARAAGAAGVRLYVDMTNSRASDVYRQVGMQGDHYTVFEQMFAMLDEPEDR